MDTVVSDCVMAAFKKYVLYVNADRDSPSQLCRGSREAMKLTKAIQEDVHVQGIQPLLKAGKPLPPWLDGSPILVDTATKQAFKGSSALEVLSSATKPPPPSEKKNEDILGMISPGERAHFDESGFEDFSPPLPKDGETLREGKVTESDLQAYIAKRGGQA